MLLQRAFIASCLAWMLGVLCFPFFWWAASKSHGIDLPFIGTFWDGLFSAFLFGAVVVFATCLLIVTPLLGLLPSSSRFWRPKFALCVGVFAGPVATYLWWMLTAASGTAGDPFKTPEGKAQMLTSVVVGGVFGYTLAKTRTRRCGCGARAAEGLPP